MFEIIFDAICSFLLSFFVLYLGAFIFFRVFSHKNALAFSFDNFSEWINSFIDEDSQ